MIKDQFGNNILTDCLSHLDKYFFHYIMVSFLAIFSITNVNIIGWVLIFVPLFWASISMSLYVYTDPYITAFFKMRDNLDSSTKELDKMSKELEELRVADEEYFKKSDEEFDKLATELDEKPSLPKNKTLH